MAAKYLSSTNSAIALFTAIFSMEMMIMWQFSEIAIFIDNEIWAAAVDALIISLFATMIIKKYYIKPIEEYGKKYISERPEYMLSQDIYKHSSQAFIVVDDEWNTVFHNSAFDIMCDINDDTATFSIKDLLKTHSVLRDIKENLSLSKSWGGRST